MGNMVLNGTSKLMCGVTEEYIAKYRSFNLVICYGGLRVDGTTLIFQERLRKKNRSLHFWCLLQPDNYDLKA